MNDVKMKTIEEHRDYLYGIVRLKLFFLFHWLHDHPEESFQNVLRNRVDIYRKTSANRGLLNPVDFFFDVPPWCDMERDAEKVYSENINDEKRFEEQAFQIFKWSVDERLEKDYLDRSGLNGYQCGSLRHNLESSAIPGTDMMSLGFHIANAVAPHSIFEDINYLKGCLLSLCNVAENDFHVNAISTHSWLNSNPKWVAYFPAEWLEHRGEPTKNVQWHYGFWGQFISARGTLNQKLADYLRQTGELKYYPCYSWCSIDSLRKHLDTLH